MLFKKRSYEDMKRRCELLESMGFDIYHEDSDVRWVHTDGPMLKFDFSATAEDSFMKHALSVMFHEAHNAGRESLKHELSQLLRLEE